MIWCVEKRNARYLGYQGRQPLASQLASAPFAKQDRLRISIALHSTAFGVDETKLFNSDDS